MGQSLGHFLDVILELEAETLSELRFLMPDLTIGFQELILLKVGRVWPRKGRISSSFWSFTPFYVYPRLRFSDPSRGRRQSEAH